MKLAEQVISKIEKKVDEAVNVTDIIKELVDTNIGGSDEEQFKFAQLLKGLAGSKDPKSTEFLVALSKTITKEKFKDFL